MMKRYAVLVFLALTAAVTPACGLLDPESDLEEELNDQLAKWLERGPASYEYRLTQICFCPPEHTRTYLVRVSNGGILETGDAETGALPPNTYVARTVIDLFNVIRQAESHDADRIDVDYDPELGFPTRLFVDLEEQAADEEYTMTAEALVSLDP